MRNKSVNRNPGRILLRLILAGVFLSLIFVVAIIMIGYKDASKPVSYLPDINILKHDQNKLPLTEVKNSWYLLSVDASGNVTVRTKDGQIILSELTYFASHEGEKEKLGLDDISARLTSDSTVSIEGKGLSGMDVKYILTVPEKQPRLEVSINSHYAKGTVVSRESLVAGFEVPVSEVYRKNRQTDSNFFDPEYWLQRQGVRFGKGERSALIYNTSLVSSLQLDTRKNLLFVNLEYSPDHPFVSIPYQEDGGARWNDHSKASYAGGQERNNSFSITFGSSTEIVPRLMLVPNGYLAGYVFTEHADGAKMNTNRAAYFGSEDITEYAEATGGFAGHRIPVTKSVFYADPDSATARYSSIHDDPDYPQFLDFLDQLHGSGLYDICLHSPENLNSNREVLEESIQFMKNRFDTRTWIDHGMYNGKINREATVADGLDPASGFYCGDFWEKYGTRYFWSPSVEMLRIYSLKDKIKKLKFHEVSFNLWKRYLSPEELHKINFFKALKAMGSRYHDKGEMNSLMSYKGNAFPTPLYWQFLTQTRDFYSWTTDYEKDYTNLSDKKVGVEKKLLDKLVSDWGVFINHGYYVRNSSEDGNLIVKNGKIVINPYFDKILGLMAKMRDDGDLYTTTIRDLLDYWTLTENVTFDYEQQGSIKIINANDKPIRGLSLAVEAKAVKINGQTPKSRKVGDNLIFWFDIDAKQSLNIITTE